MFRLHKNSHLNRVFLARFVALAVSGVGSAAVAETLIVGANAAFADSILTAAAEAKKGGLDVKVIEYTDPVVRRQAGAASQQA